MELYHQKWGAGGFFQSTGGQVNCSALYSWRDDSQVMHGLALGSFGNILTWGTVLGVEGGGTAEPAAAETITGATSGATATVAVVTTWASTSWAGSTGEGLMLVTGVTGTFQLAETVNFSGGSSATLNALPQEAWFKTKTGTGSGDQTAQTVFVDSSGTIFVSFNQVATFDGKLLRSTDNGATWTTAKALTTAANHVRSITEDELGYLYAPEYPTGELLWRSTDGGANWTDITANLASGGYSTHIHDIVYDKYRDLLFISGGDGGEGVQISADNGATWTEWATNGVVGVYPLYDHVLMCADQAANRSIFRVPLRGTTTPAAITALPSTISAHEVYIPQSPTSSQADAGFIWRFHRQTDGVIVGSYSWEALNAAVIVASDDEGITWEVTGSYPDSAHASGGAERFAHLVTELSEPYQTAGAREVSLWHFATAGTHTDHMRQWRVIQDGARVRINEAAHELGDGFYEPKPYILDNEGTGISLESNITTEEVLFKTPQIVFNGFSFTAAVQSEPTKQDASFEDLAFQDWTAVTSGGNAAPDQDSTIEPFSGRKHVEFTSTLGTCAVRTNSSTGPVVGLVEGDESWLDMEYKIVTPAPSTYTQVQWDGQSHNFGIKYSATDDIGCVPYVVDADLGSITFKAIVDEGDPILSIGKYHRVRIRTRFSYINSRVTIWIDDRLSWDGWGYPMLASTKGWTFVHIGTSGSSGDNARADNISVRKNSNPRFDGRYTLNTSHGSNILSYPLGPA